MKKNYFPFLQVWLMGFDLIALNFCAIAAWLVLDRIPESLLLHYLKFATSLNISWLVVSLISKLYTRFYIHSFEAFCRKSIRVFLGWFCLMLFYLFVLRQLELSRFFILVCMLSFGLSLLVNRLIYLLAFEYLQDRNYFIKNVLILGYNKVSKRVAEYLESHMTDTNIIGFCEEPKNVNELSNYPIISGVDGALKASLELKVNEIYSTISPEKDPRIYKLMQQADQECIRFKIIPDFSQYITYPVSISYLGDFPILSIHKNSLDEYGNKIKKRLLDIFISLIVIVFILSWLIPLIGFLIYLESPGPIFFSQHRSGKDKIPFRCLKFRSMHINKDSDLLQASKSDPRITRVGRFIRHTSLDEFPQFINVLKGEMSIVGPRPHMLKHTDDYSKLINEYMVRQFLKPGITGWAQVNGFRGETKTLDQMQHRVEHDIWYMENWSFWLDIRIIFLTMINVFKNDKNAF
jgi:putative colanic acid biosynthesis UDP-glucose lipid carrier transferase